jgi:hypothetical protein
MRPAQATRRAASDYARLLSSGYPPKATLKLVADRYRLGTAERSMLLRGVCPRRAARKRRRKATRRIRGGVLWVDGYNVLYTVACYLRGARVFLGMDGFLRDCGEQHGRRSDPTDLRRALGVVLAYCEEREVRAMHMLLDSPVSSSGELAAGIRGALADRGLEGDARAVRSPDHELRSRSSGIVATSDSAVIDACSVAVHDLAQWCLRNAFAPRFLDLRRPGSSAHFALPKLRRLGRKRQNRENGRGGEA